MKRIRYQVLQTVVINGVEQPKSIKYVSTITIPYSEENEVLAKQEAYNGEYVIESDDQSEPIPTPSSTEALESRVAALESSLLNLA